MGSFLFLATFGWVLVLLLAAGMLLVELYRYGWTKNGRPGRLFACGLLFFVGYQWQQEMVVYNFGLTLGTITTADHQRQAKIRKQGSRSYFLKVDHQPEPLTVYLIGPPQHAFWMRDGSAVGIENKGGKRIIWVDLLIKAQDFEPLTREEEERLDWSKGLTPADIAEFDQAKQRAEQLGLVWTHP